jgi:pyoverdine/dityrosine biosynthesis protein Dit1
VPIAKLAIGSSGQFLLFAKNQFFISRRLPVEMCLSALPIRLSIHVHANSGPSFSMALFDRNHTRVINDLDNLSSVARSTHDLWYIPTTWSI